MIDTIEYKVKLGKIAEFRNGLNYTKKDSGTGLKVIGVSDFQDNFYPDYSSLEEVNPEDISISDEQILKENDILFVRSNGNRDLIGRSLLIKDLTEKVSHSGFTIRLRFNKDDINPNYFLYVFKSHQFRKHLANYGGGTNISNINQQILNSIEVPCPDLETQNQIVSTLSAFDELIENNTRRIEILEEMARRIYREWFVHFRYPGHEDDKLVDSGTELGEIPEGWEVKKLEDLCELTLGQSPKSEFYNEKGEGLPFHQGVRDFGDRYPTTTTWCVKDKRIAKEGDILFSVRAPVGRINIANTKMIIGRGLHSIRSKFDNQVFIFHQLKEKFQEEDSIGSGTIYKSVTKKIMLNLKLIEPGEELIEKFEAKAVPIFKQIKVLTDKSEKLKETRDLLLPKLISGKIEINHLMESYYE